MQLRVKKKLKQNVRHKNCFHKNIPSYSKQYKSLISAKRLISCTTKLQGTATKKSDAFSPIYLHYLQHNKGTTNVFGSTLALVRYLSKIVTRLTLNA